MLSPSPLRPTTQWCFLTKAVLSFHHVGAGTYNSRSLQEVLSTLRARCSDRGVHCVTTACFVPVLHEQDLNNGAKVCFRLCFFWSLIAGRTHAVGSNSDGARSRF